MFYLKWIILSIFVMEAYGVVIKFLQNLVHC